MIVTKFKGDRYEIAPAGSADLVVSFRNLHNWLGRPRGRGGLPHFLQGAEAGRHPRHRGASRPHRSAAGSGSQERLRPQGLCHRAGREASASSSSAARKSTPTPRTPRTIRRASGRCRRRSSSATRPRQIRGDRRERPDRAEVRQAENVGWNSGRIPPFTRMTRRSRITPSGDAPTQTMPMALFSKAGQSISGLRPGSSGISR